MMAHWFYVTLQSCKWYISVFFFLKFYTEFIYVQKYLVFIICPLLVGIYCVTEKSKFE